MEKMLFKKGEECYSIVVYGVSRETGEVKVIFGRLANIPRCVRRAKEVADEHGYDIHKAVWMNGYSMRLYDVTAEFLAA